MRGVTVADTSRHVVQARSELIGVGGVCCEKVRRGMSYSEGDGIARKLARTSKRERSAILMEKD